MPLLRPSPIPEAQQVVGLGLPSGLTVAALVSVVIFTHGIVSLTRQAVERARRFHAPHISLPLRPVESLDQNQKSKVASSHTGD